MATPLQLIPPALLEPTNLWVFNWLTPIVGSIIIAVALIDALRTRRLTWGFLFLINSMLVYWMETIGDWGQHLIYSPAFATHHLLDWLPLKTPYDPVFMPFAYAIYWTVHALAVLWVGQLLVKRYNWSMLKAIVVSAIPVNYSWDLLVEGTATAMGWWTYDPGIGPVLEWPNGGRITLLWTVGLMCTWPNLIAYWGGKPPVRGLNHLERFFALERFTRPKQAIAVSAGTARTKAQAYDDALNYEITIPRWKFETLRFMAWFVGFQVSFFVFLIVPLVAFRWLAGDAAFSPYLP